MTRKEQIQKLIDEETGIDNYGSSDYQVGVCDGVRLADKTMIEKACNWLKNIMYIQTDYEVDMDGVGCTFNFLTCDFDSVDEFIEYFKKAMEAEG